MHTPDPKRYLPLLARSLAAFHTGLFLVGATTFLYVTERIGALLSELSTFIGLGLFGLLWGTTGWCVQQALRKIEWRLPDQSLPTNELLEIGTHWGGYNGILFFGSILAIGTVVVIVSGLAEGHLEILGVLPFAVLGFAVGGIFAWGIGALIGLLLALIDALLIAISKRIFQACRRV